MIIYGECFGLLGTKVQGIIAVIFSRRIYIFLLNSKKKNPGDSLLCQLLMPRRGVILQLVPQASVHPLLFACGSSGDFQLKGQRGG